MLPWGATLLLQPVGRAGQLCSCHWPRCPGPQGALSSPHVWLDTALRPVDCRPPPTEAPDARTSPQRCPPCPASGRTPWWRRGAGVQQEEQRCLGPPEQPRAPSHTRPHPERLRLTGSPDASTFRWGREVRAAGRKVGQPQRAWKFQHKAAAPGLTPAEGIQSSRSTGSHGLSRTLGAGTSRLTGAPPPLAGNHPPWVAPASGVRGCRGRRQGWA